MRRPIGERTHHAIRLARPLEMPEEFALLKDEAHALGFPHVESGPLVRSSYHADGQRDIVRELARARS